MIGTPNTQTLICTCYERSARHLGFSIEHGYFYNYHIDNINTYTNNSNTMFRIVFFLGVTSTVSGGNKIVPRVSLAITR